MKTLKPKRSTLSLVKSYVKYWTPRLRLRDWEVEVKIHDDPKAFEQFAQATHHRGFQHVLVEVLEPEKIPPEWVGKRDLEVTVVHELLHTRLIQLPRPPENETQHEEMAVETIATLMVALKRGVEPEDIE